MVKSAKSFLAIIALSLALIATVAQPASALYIEILPYKWTEVTDLKAIPRVTSKTNMQYTQIRFVNGFTHTDKRVDVSTWAHKLAGTQVINVTRTYSTY